MGITVGNSVLSVISHASSICQSLQQFPSTVSRELSHGPHVPDDDMSTTDCDQLDLLTLSDDSSKSNDQSSIATSSDVIREREVLLAVPPTFAAFPLGFTFDAGGSVTKLVYRSKLDYTAGQPNKGEHVLRLRFFPNGNGDDLLTFLKDNCDVRVTSDSETTNGERPMFYQTGVGLQHFVHKLEDAFHCRFTAFSEVEAAIDGILRVSKIIPQLKQNTPFYVESVNAALIQFRETLQLMQKIQEAGTQSYGKPPTPPNDFDMNGYIMKLMTIDPSTLAKELASSPVIFPCVYMQCGSATLTNILSENGEYDYADMNPTAGKTLLGLGRLLVGAQSFEELMTFAVRGDQRRVDLSTGDLKNRDQKEQDWYSMMPETFPVFTLGRLAEKRFDGTYAKEDLAAALINMHCTELCRTGINAARINHVTTIVFFGSFCDWPLTCRLLQENFLKHTMFLGLRGEPALTMHISPSCGFMPALGAWHENVKPR